MMTEYKHIELDKEKILDIKTQSEQAYIRYCKEIGIVPQFFDAEIFGEKIQELDILDAIRKDIENKRNKYLENFELSCICEMALLYLESVIAVKEEKDDQRFL